jgi:hypothetical protein
MTLNTQITELQRLVERFTADEEAGRVIASSAVTQQVVRVVADALQDVEKRLEELEDAPARLAPLPVHAIARVSGLGIPPQFCGAAM